MGAFFCLRFTVKPALTYPANRSKRSTIQMLGCCYIYFINTGDKTMYKLLPVVREWRGEFTVGKMVDDVFVPICICENKKQADDLCQETIEEMLK